MHPDIERLALLGWHLYPCLRNHKGGCFKGAHNAATCDLDTLAKWAVDYESPNWRVVFGPSGLWGLDLDVAGSEHDADGVQAFANLARGYSTLPRCPTTRSGGGGMALFFAHHGEPIAGRTGYPAPGVDPRRGAQSVTVPPSIHVRTKRPYEWLVAPWDCRTPDAPEWLLSLVKPPPEPEIRRPDREPSEADARRIIGWAVDTIKSAPPGAANDTLNRCMYWVARWAASDLLSAAEAAEHIARAAQDRAIPAPEYRATIKSAMRKGLTNPI